MAQKHISIKLWFEDEKKFKTFIAPRTNTKTLLEALRLNAEAEKTADNLEKSIKILEKQLQFIVGIFRNQFTYDQLFEGLESFEVAKEVSRILSEVAGYKEIEAADQDFLPEQTEKTTPTSAESSK
ncbi:phage tail assembly chaperone G [Bacillus velezensis]|uniref:phage tail assembly chaperone G n=1 Tax=Bacillus velezensis TaxID=492670 RepID=UPI0034E5E078